MIDPRNPDYTNTPSTPGRPRFDYQPVEKNTPPVATIITPFFNVGPIFEETARSVFGQSFQQWEWLIVNDGSSDPESLAILDAYRNCDPRVRVIDHAENRGLSAARNTGYAQAQTPYVLQLDGDDLLEPTTVEKSVWFLESNPDCAFVKGYSVGFGTQEYLWARGFDDAQGFLHENVTTATAMVRRDVQQAVGGFDEKIRGGMEDWDFWLRCADRGHWGATIPEYLDWYRRRDLGDRDWSNLEGDERHGKFRKRLRESYPRVFRDGFPKVRRDADYSVTIRTDLPCENRLVKNKPRLLMILPWLTMGGADKFNLDVVEQVASRGWEVSIAATLWGRSAWLSEFARFTPDIFALHHFLNPADFPPFLRYLIESRRPDLVLISNSEFGYWLLPYLRACCPEPAYVDYCHMEEEQWKSGGYPRYAVRSQELLDLNLVSSRHLKNWMTERGADGQRIEVVYTNIDPEKWKPDRAVRARVRRELDVADGLPLILYAVRLAEQKQPRVFARVMRELAVRKLEFCALVAGDGPDLPWLEQYVRENSLEPQVRLLGPQPLDRIRELLPASDILFLPSQWEGIALSVFEAMSCGLAVVGAVVGGQSELVTAECGVLLPRADADTEVRAYAEQLTPLIRDRARREALGRLARNRIVERFTLDLMGEGMLAAFARAARLRQESPPPALSTRAAYECARQAVDYLRTSTAATQLWENIRELHEMLAAKQARIDQLEEAKTWLEQQRTNWQETAQAHQTWIAELEQAKNWAQEHQQRWQARSEEQEAVIQDLRGWAEKQEGIIHELQEWATELERAKAWHDDRHARLRAACAQWKQQRLFRILRRAKLLRDLTME